VLYLSKRRAAFAFPFNLLPGLTEEEACGEHYFVRQILTIIFVSHEIA
jgi:hypothetical protein